MMFAVERTNAASALGADGVPTVPVTEVAEKLSVRLPTALKAGIASVHGMFTAKVSPWPLICGAVFPAMHVESTGLNSGAIHKIDPYPIWRQRFTKLLLLTFPAAAVLGRVAPRVFYSFRKCFGGWVVR
jgi:hypothetical protein